MGKKLVRENPIEELVAILKYATKGYRSDKDDKYQGCINCAKHWIAIKQIINQLGGYHVFKETLIRGREGI